MLERRQSTTQKSDVTSKQVKEWILSIVGSDELLGVSYGEGYAMYPDGSQMGHCTSSAQQVVAKLGRGEIWGFFQEENPSAASAESCSGHDFVVFDNRYIVDVWVSLFAGIATQIVFDLDEHADRAEVLRLYGDRSSWKKVSRD